MSNVYELWNIRNRIDRGTIINLLTCGYTATLDNRSALHSRRASRKAISSLGAVMLSGVLCSNAVAATPVTEIYKTYAHIKLNNHKEYICLEALWTKESNWNPYSKNKRALHTAYHSYLI